MEEGWAFGFTVGLRFSRINNYFDLSLRYLFNIIRSAKLYFDHTFHFKGRKGWVQQRAFKIKLCGSGFISSPDSNPAQTPPSGWRGFRLFCRVEIFEVKLLFDFVL